MCGIFAFYARESVPNKQFFFELLKEARNRGNDGVGVNIFNRNKELVLRIKSINCSDDYLKELSLVISNSMSKGDILLGNFRAAPETEPLSTMTDELNLQPIFNPDEKLCVAHNGAISSQSYDELKEKSISKGISKVSNIDSEAILWAYSLSNYDLKRTLEDSGLSGGWSFILLDLNKWRLLSACAANPFSHGYIRGVGYIIHSSLNVYSKLMKALDRRVDKCGAFAWEDFYWHERDGFRYFEMDLDSGAETAGKYKHYFIHPTWNSKDEGNGKKYLVCASGGLDSSTTACILKSKGYDIELVHFKYGHRGDDAEQLAVEKLSKYLDVKLTTFDLREHYKIIDNFSMLTNKDVRIVTGMKPKTTNAWTCGRNMLFLAYLGAYAESLIMQNHYEKVFICGGYSNLTESGTYPDNTEKFVYAMEEAWKYGTLAGAQYRLKHINVCANITKYEQILVLKELGMEDVLEFTVSCDRPIVKDSEILQCQCETEEFGKMPACGSGLLSWWAMKKAKVEDPRKYYLIDDKDYKPFIPEYLKSNELDNVHVTKEHIKNIMDRLIFE